MNCYTTRGIINKVIQSFFAEMEINLAVFFHSGTDFSIKISFRPIFSQIKNFPLQSQPLTALQLRISFFFIRASWKIIYFQLNEKFTTFINLPPIKTSFLNNKIRGQRTGRSNLQGPSSNHLRGTKIEIDCLARLDVLKGRGGVRRKKKKEEKTIVVETGAWLLSQPSESTPGVHIKSSERKVQMRLRNFPLPSLPSSLPPAKDSAALSRETES